MTGFVCSQEIFSLKKSYDSQVFIEGTDQVSIKQGMQLALSSLLVNISGNSKIVDEKSIRIMIEGPEKYVTQYKLGSADKKIYAKEHLFQHNVDFQEGLRQIDFFLIKIF